MKRLWTPMIAIVATLALGAEAVAADFSYQPPGQLVSGSGTGRVDDTVYVTNMRFPIEVAPAYPNSQVWGVGGYRGPSGGQCDSRNYSYPWWDNYCESRSWDMPLCPSGNGHQGQDIRPSTCADKTHFAVAAEDGTITSIGSYSVNLTTASGTLHRYLHMDPGTLRVSRGQSVSKGDRLGLVSNAFNGTPTTIHLHYDIRQYVQSVGQSVYVPTYMSLVRSYEDLIGQPAEPCAIVGEEGATLDDYGDCFTPLGNPRFWREESSGGHDGRFHWTNAWSNDTPGNWARWAIHVAKTGEYRVEFNVVSDFAKSKRTRYAIKHADGESTVEVDQSAVRQWGELGVFTFAEGQAHAVEVFDNTGETGDDLHITADAIRLTPVTDEPEPQPEPDEEPDIGDPPAQDKEEPRPQEPQRPGEYVPEQSGSVSTSSGCTSVGGQSSSWLVIFALLGMVGARRSPRSRRDDA